MEWLADDFDEAGRAMMARGVNVHCAVSNQPSTSHQSAINQSSTSHQPAIHQPSTTAINQPSTSHHSAINQPSISYQSSINQSSISHQSAINQREGSSSRQGRSCCHDEVGGPCDGHRCSGGRALGAVPRCSRAAGDQSSSVINQSSISANQSSAVPRCSRAAGEIS